MSLKLLVPLGVLYLVGCAAPQHPDAAAFLRDATARWRASCPVPLTDGLCLKPGRTNTARTCNAKAVKMIVARRSTAEARRALDEFSHILALAAVPVGERVPQETVAAALFHTTDAELERFLSRGFPTNLDFSADEPQAKGRLAKYLKTKGELLAQLQNGYGQVILEGQPVWAVAASMRIGMLYSEFADDLSAAPVPTPSIPARVDGSDEARFLAAFADTFCDAMASKAHALRQKARAAFSICARKAKELGLPDHPWAERCLAELKRVSTIWSAAVAKTPAR